MTRKGIFFLSFILLLVLVVPPARSDSDALLGSHASFLSHRKGFEGDVRLIHPAFGFAQLKDRKLLKEAVAYWLEEGDAFIAERGHALLSIEDLGEFLWHPNDVVRQWSLKQLRFLITQKSKGRPVPPLSVERAQELKWLTQDLGNARWAIRSGAHQRIIAIIPENSRIIKYLEERFWNEKNAGKDAEILFRLKLLIREAYQAHASR